MQPISSLCRSSSRRGRSLSHALYGASGRQRGKKNDRGGCAGRKGRQGFFPDGSRSFEEIDRLQIGVDGVGNLISLKAGNDFYRAMPPGATAKACRLRCVRTRVRATFRPKCGVATFSLQAVASHRCAVAGIPGTRYQHGQRVLLAENMRVRIWTESSPTIEETIYWLNLLIDATLPICGNAAQRPHGQSGEDGPKNIIDSIDYITSRVWADSDGRDRAGAVLIQEQQIFAARDVQKVDARPGGYVATGGHGGILGASGHDGRPLLHYLPTAKHTYKSEVSLTRLPTSAPGLRRDGPKMATVKVPIKNSSGDL